MKGYKPIDYTSDFRNQMRQQRDANIIDNQNLRKINHDNGSYHQPLLGADHKPVFRGQNIFIDDYKHILQKRKEDRLVMKSYLIKNRKELKELESSLAISKRRNPGYSVSNNRSRSLLKQNHLDKTTKLEPLKMTSM